MSGYTTSISTEDAYNPKKNLQRSKFSSQNLKLLKKLLKNLTFEIFHMKDIHEKIREMLIKYFCRRIF